MDWKHLSKLRGFSVVVGMKVVFLCALSLLSVTRILTLYLDLFLI